MNWRSSHVELHNLRFFGETDKWKEIAAIQEAERFCRSPWHNVDGQDVPVGIQWSTYDTRWYAWEERNIIADVEFAGFDEGQSPGCTPRCSSIAERPMVGVKLIFLAPLTTIILQPFPTSTSMTLMTIL